MHPNRLKPAAAAVLLGLLAVPTPAAAVPPPPQSAIVINEVQTDPAPDLAGDANGDGVRDTYQDEFVELLNRGPVTVDLSGFQLQPAGASAFVFPAGTRLGPGAYLVVFGGGEPAPLPGPALTAGGRLGNGLPNSAGRLLLIDPAGPDTLQDLSWQDWDVDGSMVRDPEGWGDFVRHATRYGTRFSPAAPGAEGGGPFSDRPSLYRLRVVNRTSAGFGLAWRTGTEADGRLEVYLSDHWSHRVDEAPIGVLHHASLYGLAPGTSLGWRVVSAGTLAPADTLSGLQTGPVVTSVPAAVYGRLAGPSGPVAGAHVFLRAGPAGADSGWLLARTDEEGRWSLNLGNLRAGDGSAWPWSVGDSLEVEADAGPVGVSAVSVTVSGVSPQEITLPLLDVDPPPFFEWRDGPVTLGADTTVVLAYALTDPGGAWARVHLLDTSGEPREVETEPALLGPATAGEVRVHTAGLPEGSLWGVGAVIEDGLNPPQAVTAEAMIRVAHPVSRGLLFPAGIILFTPVLADEGLGSAGDWLDRLAAPAELARWDGGSAAWVSLARLGDGTRVGEDFEVVPGRGYALVSHQGGEVVQSGPRRYGPPGLEVGPGLALAGVSDSSRVRTATEVLADAGVRAVSRWDPQMQRWEGRFRLPDGILLGDEFTVGWGEAVALEAEGITAWTPRPRAASAPRMRESIVDGGALVVVDDRPGVMGLRWCAPAGAEVRLERAGIALWRTVGTLPGKWEAREATGLPPGTFQVVLEVPAAEGMRRWVRQARVAPAAPPRPPVWAWGPATLPGELLLLSSGSGRVEARRVEGERFTAEISGLLPADGPWRLTALGTDGDWSLQELQPLPVSGPLHLEPVGTALRLSGLAVDPAGPVGITLHWQVLAGDEQLRFLPFLAWSGESEAEGGPSGDGRIWRPQGEELTWCPGDPAGLSCAVALLPGPRGETGPEAVAVRLCRRDGLEAWIGPAALTTAAAAGHPRLDPPAPNPFNPRTTLRFTLPPGGPWPLRLEVRDVRGRLVRSLIEGERSGGSYAVEWDGRTDAGRPVASGIYLVLLEVAGERFSRKLLLLR